MSIKSFREILNEIAMDHNDHNDHNTENLVLATESAIPVGEIDENTFKAKSFENYLIVFIDMVDSTSILDKTDGNIDKITDYFGTFNQTIISSFKLTVSSNFKFKMMGDGLLFFVPTITQEAQLLNYKDKCEKLNKSIQIFPVRTVAGKGKLIEFNVGLKNGWTDYYGIKINDIVHASKDMKKGEYKWI